MSFLNLRKKKETVTPSTGSTSSPQVKLGAGTAAVAAVPAKKISVYEEKMPSTVSAKASPRTSESLGVASARPIRVVEGAQDAAVILRPRVTEKASALTERGVYSFEVVKGATERTVKAAIRSLYKVSPIKVAFVPLRSKEIIVKGKKGRTKGGKKAYVFLKSGEKIEVL